MLRADNWTLEATWPRAFALAAKTAATPSPGLWVAEVCPRTLAPAVLPYVRRGRVLLRLCWSEIEGLVAFIEDEPTGFLTLAPSAYCPTLPLIPIHQGDLTPCPHHPRHATPRPT